MLRFLTLAFALIGLAGCGPLTYEAPINVNMKKPAIKTNATYEVKVTPHSRKQKLVVTVRSGGVPVDVCAVYDMPNRVKEAREDMKNGQKHLPALAQVIQEPDPVLRFDLPPQHPLMVIVFNPGERTPDIEVIIKTE